MEKDFEMKATSAPHKGECKQCFEPGVKTVTQFELTSKRRPRRRPAPSGPPKKDTRARYKEPWRERA